MGCDKMMHTGHLDRNRRAIRQCSFVTVDNGARMGQVFWSSTFLRWEINFPDGSTEPLNRYGSKDITVKDQSLENIGKQTIFAIC